MPSYELELRAFEGYNTQVLGVSVDHIPCLKAWAESLGGISYPLLSDFWPHGAVAQLYGVFRDDGKSERALFIVDKSGIVRYVDIHDIDQQPDIEELFIVLQKLEPDAVVVRHKADADAAGTLGPAPARGKPRSVVLYCRPGCIDCRLARRFLETHGVQYTEINIRATPDAEERVRRWTGGPIISPVFDIDGTIVIDFDRSQLTQVLGLG